MKKLPVVISAEEIDRLCSCCDNPNNALMFRVMYYLGLRVSEACYIRKEDFDIKERIAKVTWQKAKGHKERLVPIPAPLVSILKHWFVLMPGEGRLFNVSRVTVWNRLKRAAQGAGITKDIHPHTLRHSYATEVLKGTGRLEVVQDLLGHSSIATTRIYTHLCTQDLSHAIEKVWK